MYLRKGQVLLLSLAKPLQAHTLVLLLGGPPLLTLSSPTHSIHPWIKLQLIVRPLVAACVVSASFRTLFFPPLRDSERTGS